MSQEKDFIGYTDRKEGYISKEHLPIVIFGDHNKEVKYVDYEFFVGADGVKMLKFNDNEILPRYAFFIIQSRLVQDQIVLQQSAKYSRHFKYLKNCKIPLPPLAEQQSIVDELEEREELIDKLRKMITKKEDEMQNIIKNIW